MIAHFILAFGIVSGTLLWGQEGRAPQTPLTREEIRRAVADELRKGGLREEQLPRLDDIELPAVLSAAPDRALRVSAACWDANLERAQFRLECARRHCLPFLVHVRMERPVLASCRILPRPPESAQYRPAVRVGDRAMAVFLGSRLRLTSAVTCLEHGTEGDVIRVRNPNGHIFQARISGPGLLEVLPQR